MFRIDALELLVIITRKVGLLWATDSPIVINMTDKVLLNIHFMAPCCNKLPDLLMW